MGIVKPLIYNTTIKKTTRYVFFIGAFKSLSRISTG